MRSARLAAYLGVLASGGVLALFALPYGYARGDTVATYYGVGSPGPLFVSLLVVIAAIALLAGVQERSDPPTAAGAAVAVGILAAVLALAWALPAREVVAGMAVPDWFEYHPVGFVVATALVAVSGGLFARATFRSPVDR